MTSPMYSFVTIFIMAGSFLSYASADYDRYVSLIDDVRTECRASSVFFVFSEKMPLMEEYTKMHSLFRTFSEDRVFTLITHFNGLKERLDYDQKRIGRPLVVIFVKSFDDITEFDETTRTIDKSFPCWLMIFHGNSSDRFCEYCDRPEGNKFGLRLDTLMLVLCCESTTLQEWWSVNENRTEIGQLGTWNAYERLNVSGTKGMTPRGRDARGAILRIVIVANSQEDPHRPNRFRGLFDAVLRELKKDIKFETTEIPRSEGFGTYNLTSNTWSGAMGMLTRGEVDLAIPITMTELRLGAVDFTHPLLVTPFKLFIKKPDGKGVNWLGYFEVFTLEIWATIIALAITAPLLLTIMKMKQGSETFGRLYIENCVFVWGIFCQQALFEFPAENPLKMAYYSIFVSGIVVLAAYSASMISFITVSITALPFSNLADFVGHGSYKLIVDRTSMYYDLFDNSTSPLYQEMKKAMKPWDRLPENSKEAWEQVCSERVAFVTSDVTRRTVDTKCEVVDIDTVGVSSLAIALPHGSQYTEVINYHIERYKAIGIFHRLKETYYSKDEPVVSTYDVVELSGVTPILSILAGGVIIALVIWFCEKMLHTVQHRSNRRSFRDKPRKLDVTRFSNAREKEESQDWPLRPGSRSGKVEKSFFGYYP